MSKKKYVNPDLDVVVFRPKQILAVSGNVTSFGASFSDPGGSEDNVWGDSDDSGFNDFGSVDVVWD